MMFFAWAIGGEKYFGKWRRGALLAIPMTVIGLFVLPWHLHVIQIVALWAVYQGISYDWGIRAVYEKNLPLKGWPIIVLNGALIGLSAIAFMMARGSIVRAIIAEVLIIVGFMVVVILANDARFKSYRDWLNKYMPAVTWLNFKDAWYVSSGIMGAIIGMGVVLCLL